MTTNGSSDGWTKWWPRFLSTAGLIGIYYEMIIAQIDRPWLLAVLAGMTGVAPVLQFDKWLSKGGNGEVK